MICPLPDHIAEECFKALCNSTMMVDKGITFGSAFQRVKDKQEACPLGGRDGMVLKILTTCLSFWHRSQIQARTSLRS